MKTFFLIILTLTCTAFYWYFDFRHKQEELFARDQMQIENLKTKIAQVLAEGDEACNRSESDEKAFTENEAKIRAQMADLAAETENLQLKTDTMDKNIRHGPSY